MSNGTSLVCDVTPWWWSRAWQNRLEPETRSRVRLVFATITAIHDDLEELRVSSDGVELRFAITEDTEMLRDKADAIRSMLDELVSPPPQVIGVN
jgi:hypothetical protein